ncbi:MAG: PEP/pyruvate-binding domain-containing protein, partial [Cyanobacteriota bacterium]
MWPGLVLLPEAYRQSCAAGEERPRGLSEPLLAVRSSAGGEDGPLRSFAGQFATELEVPPAELEAAILRVWNSAFAARPLAYAWLVEGRDDSIGKPPAVLLQPMLPARVAGVAFAADPVSGQRGVTLIQAVEGLAVDLVAGRATGEAWRLDREGQILEHRPLAPGPPLLRESTVRELARLVRAVSRALGAPQDVEWALEIPAEGGERLWLLQARPITALRHRPDPDGAPGLWDNSNLVESYGGVTTPLTFSFARRAYTEVYARFCRFMGVDAATVLRHRAVFARMIGFHHGRLYYNLRSWYRVLSLLPGYDLNAGFLEQMLGVRERLTPAQRRELRLEPRRSRAADGLRLAGTGAALVRNA